MQGGGGARSEAGEPMVGQGAIKGGGRGGFDAFQLVRQRQEFGGVIDARTLPRVVDRLAGAEAVPLAWRIAGTADASGRPAVAVAIEGGVPLECQGCLQAFTWPVQQRTLLLLARDEAELGRLDALDEHEVVLASAPLDARELVEDELLLTLPFAPRCTRTDCGVQPADAPAERAPSAFAALAGVRAPDAGKRRRGS